MSANDATDLGEFYAEDDVRALHASIHTLQGELRRARSKHEALSEAARRGAYEAALRLGKPPKVPAPKPRGGKGKPEAAILHLSDWQTGKKTSSFDSEVAEERVEELGSKLVRICEIEEADHPVSDIYLLYGGDHVEGVNVFPGQQYEIDSTLFEQHVRAARMLVNITRRAATIAPVHVVTEDGNHGRIGRRGELPKGDNSDAFTYYNAKMQLADLIEEARLEWIDTTHGWHSIFEIGAYKGLLVHGDEIKGFGGQTPAFGIAKKVTAWASGVIDPFHDCYMGHWHQPLVIPLPVGHRRVFVNPSIESDNIYAQEFVGANGYPGQRLNFVSPDKGRVTAERVLWLD